ncbi:hypothetical protein NERG_01466 [Nematocida ausubeli]|uniref:PPPDE domain-containing protein n=1 Tax=Nematocida ausubeli (strain ATCC PRA-371 / ERTm2) TaxID=1913371 RepID=H8ZCM3_NEMA1|nr:hypothetical protein NERG_01466 [Nematocida ausubeli]
MQRVELWVYNIGNDSAVAMIRGVLGVDIQGIWHTSLHLFGKEYYFMSGIRADRPGTSPFGAPARKIELGETGVTEEELTSYLKKIDELYTEQTYHIIRNNCNHFSNNLAKYLVNKEVPAYIMDVAKMFENTPFEALLAGLAPGRM